MIYHFNGAVDAMVCTAQYITAMKQWMWCFVEFIILNCNSGLLSMIYHCNGAVDAMVCTAQYITAMVNGAVDVMVCGGQYIKL